MKKYLTLIFILFSSVPDYAGQLHIRRYGLAQVIQNAGYVISIEAVEHLYKKNCSEQK